MQRSLSVRALFAICLTLFPPGAWAQIPYDPPTATRPEPNVMLLIDATRTNLINGSSCRGNCHTEAAMVDMEYSASMYLNGETRLQLARRVLTGGFGWNTGNVDSDALIRTDGVMDTYKVRWGVAWYDGLGTRFALDPTPNNALAQQTVIDFGTTPNDSYGYMPPMNPAIYPPPQLNSWVPYWRTTRLGPGVSGSVPPNQPTAGAYDPYQPNLLPWYAETNNAASRMGRALSDVRKYWQSVTAAPAFSPPTGGEGFFSAYPAPNDAVTIDSDSSNTMTGTASGSCRRNITVLLSDGHGDTGGSPPANAEAQTIHLLPASDGALSSAFSNQVFAIHFGAGIPTTSLDGVSFAGTGGFIPTAFDGAPGGQITDLSPMLAAFSSIFSLTLSGTYTGAAPTITRYGDYLARSYFTVQDCSGGTADSCNIGRPGHLEWYGKPKAGLYEEPRWDAGEILETRLSSDRNLFTTPPVLEPGAATDSNCGVGATCADPSLSMIHIDDQHGWGALGNFMRGDPAATFANGVARGAANDTDDANYKLSDIANSRAVIVGAPAGFGEEVDRWNAFLDLNAPRTTPNGSFAGGMPRDYGPTVKVRNRDQVMYVGGNDGFLHAFLTGSTKKGAVNGKEAKYKKLDVECPSGLAQVATTAACDGMELWAYSPRFLQPNWSQLRGGHYLLVDGTPVVADVLFTKRSASPGAVCDGVAVPCGWEYRTVLLQCLGGGGPGCFAMDVTNPFAPQVLWERTFSSELPGVAKSTSKPLVIKVKRDELTSEISYYVAVTGGGLDGPGHFVAIGLEDGKVFTTLDTGSTAAEADFAGSPTCIDADNDSFIDTCYIATTSASVYKIRFTGGNPDVLNGGGMTMVKFFDARDATGVTTLRAFQSAVSTFNTVDGVVHMGFTTGNAEDILATGEQNYFIKLVDAFPATMEAFDAVNPATTNTWNVDRMATSCSAAAEGLTQVGGATSGKFALPAGEKALFDPVLSNGTMTFATYQPSSNSCVAGSSFLYGLRLESCNDSLKVKGLEPDPYTGRIALGQGLPTQPIVNEKKKTVVVTMDPGTARSATGAAGKPAQVPLTKLWWREVLF